MEGVLRLTRASILNLCLVYLSAGSTLMQDKELAEAAGRFAECQKTIASLGRQLKTLATLDDFLIDSETATAVV